MWNLFGKGGKKDGSEGMKCKKCGKEMEFLKTFMLVSQILVPSPEEMAIMLNNQIVLCENCGQPYRHVKKMGKLSLKMLTDRWVARQSKEYREKLAKDIDEQKETLKTAKLVREWQQRMTA